MAEAYSPSTGKLFTLSIVNDAAWVGYEIADVLRKRGFRVKYLPRGRNFFSKTFGVVLNALRAEGLTHVNYALQDAYMLKLLGKGVDILHLHGSDIRWSVNSKLWGWMVKSDLKAARRVFVSTPDLLDAARRFRDDVEYLPNPVDTERFKPPEVYPKGLSALYFKLWYEDIPESLIHALKEFSVELHIVEGRPYPYMEMHKVYSAYHIFIDRFTIPSFSKSCLEAMACALPTIDYRHKDELRERVAALTKAEYRREEGVGSRRYVEKHHDRLMVVDRLIEVYRGLEE